ncbi:MAG: aromatic ring-hydroxylating dioxygenase subunit alpha [Actinomycetia bacterium]|nr:aromatic ring-hydroxylating dioxygenase subunit alpha [Actinomycetes bacterium]
MSPPTLDPFPRGWYQAAFAQDLAPGEVRPLRMLGQDLVLWRDTAGAPHVFDAFCAHLGAHLGYGGRVEGNVLRCPFHAWKYDGAGDCVEIPYSAKGLGRARVRSHPVMERNGMLLWWWDPQAREPDWEVPEIAEWADPEWSDGYVRTHCWTIRSKWREIAENGVDMTHFHYLHGVAAQPELDGYHTDGPVWRSRTTHRFDTPLGQRPGSFQFELHGPGVGWQRFTIDGVAEVLFAISISQIDVDFVTNRFSFLVPRQPLGSRAAQMTERLVQEIIDQVTDDVPIWEHKMIKDPPMLARGDGPIMAFRRWTQQFAASTGSPAGADRGAPVTGSEPSGALAAGSAAMSGGSGASASPR